MGSDMERAYELLVSTGAARGDAARRGANWNGGTTRGVGAAIVGATFAAAAASVVVTDAVVATDVVVTLGNEVFSMMYLKQSC